MLLVAVDLSLAGLGQLRVVLHLLLQIIDLPPVSCPHSLEVLPDDLQFLVALPLRLEGLPGELGEGPLQ